MKTFLLLLLLTITLHAGAQYTTQAFYNTRGTPGNITYRSNGHWIQLPSEYASRPTKRYALLVETHGRGGIGSGSSTALPKAFNGLPGYSIWKKTFPPYFVLAGDTLRLIVITPQWTAMPSAADIKATIDFSVKRYRVDTTRIYLAGISMGGGSTWNYLSSSKANARRIAAAVIVCGAASPTKEKAAVLRSANIPIWATHNDSDRTVNVSNTKGWIKYINAAVTPTRPAKVTIFRNTSHNAWSATFNPKSTAFETGNIFRWLLKNKRTITLTSKRKRYAGSTGH